MRLNAFCMVVCAENFNQPRKMNATDLLRKYTGNESNILFLKVIHIPCNRLTIYYLIQKSARVTVNIYYFVTLLLDVAVA